MDLVRLLSRGARSNQRTVQQQEIPSAQAAPPKLRESLPQGKKRKRGEVDTGQRVDSSKNASRNAREDEDGSINTQIRDLAQRQALLKQHKIKVVHLDSSQSKSRAANGQAKPSKGSQYFPDPCLTIAQVAGRYDLPLWLSNSLRNEGYNDATEVQMAALPLLLESNKDRRYPESDGEEMRDIDLLTVAPTGSGKTLAFLIPVLAKIARSADDSSKAGTTPQALILAPTRELVEQIVSVGRRLTHKSSIRIKRYQKSTSLAKTDESNMKQPAILVSTPGMLHSALARDELQRDALASVTYLILDEADVLLDPLFREQTTTIWTTLPNPDLKVSLWSATMGSNIEDLARTTIEERRLALEEEGMSPQKPSLLRLVIGLKDSAVPNVQHKLIYAATEQGKLLGLRQLLHPGTTTTETGPVLRPPFIVFTQTIERAVALHSELLYDIPAEAGGSSRIAVLHSDLSDSARDAVMARFRRAELWVLITTDLLSRGIDFRGVNGVVNYDIPSSSAAYVHRIGRTGRAGRTGGVAVTLYTEEDIPYLKHVANVIAVAQRNGNGQDAGIQQWLLDALPSLGKNDKKKLKKHGVEARTARGMADDPRGARKAKISTKAGFVRREENRKKGAIEASRRRAQAATNDNDESDFEDLDG